MSKFIGTDIQQKVIAILESKKAGDLVKYKRLARDLNDMSLAVRSVENSIGVGVGKLESFYPKCVYEMCSKTVIVSAHSLAHEDELLKKNLRFLLVDSTVMAFRYYTDELSKNFSGFVKPTGNELTNIVRPSIINDGEFYPDGLYKSSLLESTVPSLKLIESKFKTNPVILYNNANDMANWNKAKGIILDRFPEAVNVVWIRMIVDNTSEENSVKEPCGVLERLFSEVELLRRRCGEDSTLEFFTEATSMDMRYGINVSICIFQDSSDGLTKGVLNTFYSGSDSFAGNPKYKKTNMVFEVVQKILDDIQLDDTDIEIMNLFENETIHALVR